MLSSPSVEEDHDSDKNLYNEEEDDDDDDENEDQNLFSPPDRPSTPKKNHFNATALGELSPPQSQSASQRVGAAADDTATTGVMNGDAEAAAHKNVNGTGGGASMHGDQNGATHVPGMGWKTKKANEDYHRAAETLADRDFSLREFGDLFDDRAIVRQ